jgi:AbiU2
VDWNSADAAIERWQGDLKVITNEVLAMNQRREIFRLLGEITTKHGSLPSSAFFSYLNATYSATQAAAVRRQADKREDVISLRRLLTEIKEHPTLLTREWYASIYTDSSVSPDQSWERYAGDVGHHVDPALVENDLEALLEAAEKARQWTNKHIAHSDRERLDVGLTFGELDKGVDATSFFMTRYTTVLTGSSWWELSDVEGLRHDLEWLFSQPWIKR